MPLTQAQITSRRRFIQFMAASPLFAGTSLSALAAEPYPERPADPFVWAPRDYDHVAANMQQLAAIMRTELEEWRFVIESRRSRAGRRRVKRKRNLLRVISDLWKRPGAPNSDAAGDSTPDAR